jgi:phospholipid transport system substrate-binding protein
VTHLHAELESVLRAGAEQPASAPRERLAAALDAAYDFPEIARRALRAHWEELADGQRLELTRALRGYALAEHVARLAGTGKERFSQPVLSERDATAARVEAKLERGDGAPLELSYELHATDGVWRIVDVRTSAGDGRGRLAAELRRAFEADGPAGPAAWLARQSARLDETPRAVVERLQSGLLALMRAADTLGFDGRARVLEPLFDDTHDSPAIAELSLKDAWSGLTAAQRAEFTAELRALAIATYAGRFAGFSGERFQVDSDKPVRGGGAMVRTTLVKADGSRVALDYLLHRAEGRWRILNIVADGVSDLALKRAEYASLLAREGFAGLLATLRAQTAKQR